VNLSDLGPFPTDDETLDLLLVALEPGPRCSDCAGSGQPVVPGPGELCGTCNGRGSLGVTLTGVLDLLSGYDPAQVTQLVNEYDQPVPDVYEYTGGAIYVAEDVIRALIAEVRSLRSVGRVSPDSGVETDDGP
jgi:hypothetical protein